MGGGVGSTRRLALPVTVDMCGSTTVWVIAAVNAASTALPPRLRESRPRCVAIGCELMIMPSRLFAPGLPPNWASRASIRAVPTCMARSLCGL
jgi:hypothetical protein